jgi:hypothetical protein
MRVQKQEPIKVKTEDGWVVVLQPVPWSDAVELWIGRQENGRFYRASVAEGGLLNMTEVEKGSEQTSPTLVVSATVWDGLAEALRGVVPQVDKREVDAELKATKYHLEDMRNLVFEQTALEQERRGK